MLAASMEEADFIRMLLNAKANPGSVDDAGHDALWFAVKLGTLEGLKLLSAKEANLHRQYRQKETLLILAASRGETGMVGVLIKDNGNIDQTGNTGNTALMMASHLGREKIGAMLLQKGSNPDLRNHNGDSALMLAAREGHQAVIKRLLAGNANPNLRNKKREQAVDLARLNNHTAIVEQLEQTGSGSEWLDMFRLSR
ncbi:MAG: hypothetical protein DIZ77_05520 [endosymbiont of Seepiophila jonesi]|uniref:Uncharacterized protein n=1 Tax=endosymbiont of Lamellibrachia luymesi TaxID=2200907 RepID=A0A370DW57_9GAMM|nr:MAG: hypothetical protein DIZ79_13915 [endosymbiont of Lamellibrachia luymesi]RDH93660.1 MAG: hypothetical protein DIZ77_05520 [endosymbiont of Seepiophila jonesi]